MDYLIYVGILIGVYAILSISLNLLIGYTGLLSMAHAAFFGFGAYIVALMALSHQAPFLTSLFFALILCGVLGVIVGLSSLRVHDDYFVIVTFGLQIIAFSILNNWISVTGGPMGLRAIPQPEIFGWLISSGLEFLLITSFLACLCFIISWQIVRSPIGRILKAIREDEILPAIYGKNVAWFKILVFSVSGAMAALAGGIYAHYISFIDPTSFTILESIFIISIVIIGGAGSLWGPVFGAVVLVILPEILRFIGLPSDIAGNVRQIIYGGLLVAFMLWRPKGFIGQYSFQKSSKF